MQLGPDFLAQQVDDLQLAVALELPESPAVASGSALDGGAHLRLRPSLPAAWDQARIQYRDPRTGGAYDLRLVRDAALPPGAVSATVDGVVLPLDPEALRVPLRAGVHTVVLRLGA